MPRPNREQPNNDQPNPPRTIANTPIRTVIYVEVGDLSPTEARQAFQAVRDMHRNFIDPVYVIPVRHGKLRGDVIFETEILAMINQICEIRDNQIALKNGVPDVQIVRINA